MKSKRTQSIEGRTVKELAASYGKSVTMMHKVCGVLKPVGRHGQANAYDPKAVQSLLSGKVERSKKSDRVKELEKRKLELQCRKLEVEIDEKAGKLIPVDDVRQFVTMHTSTVTTHARRQGGELAPLLQGLSVAKAEKKINAANEEMIAKLRSMSWGG